MPPRIVTAQAPPNEARSYRLWFAYYEGNENGDCGYGTTRDDAIRDLVDNCEVPEGE